MNSSNKSSPFPAVMCQAMQRLHILLQNPNRLFVRGADRVRPPGQSAAVSAEQASDVSPPRYWFCTVSSATTVEATAQRQQARDHHRRGSLGRLFDVVGCAGRDQAEDHSSGRAAASQGRNLVGLPLFPAHQIVLALVHLHGGSPARPECGGTMVILVTGAELLCLAATSAWPISW